MEGELSANCKMAEVNPTKAWPLALSNHSEFDGDGTRNACAYQGYTQRQLQLYILDSWTFSAIHYFAWNAKLAYTRHPMFI